MAGGQNGKSRLVYALAAALQVLTLSFGGWVVYEFREARTERRALEAAIAEDRKDDDAIRRGGLERISRLEESATDIKRRLDRLEAR